MRPPPGGGYRLSASERTRAPAAPDGPLPGVVRRQRVSRSRTGASFTKRTRTAPVRRPARGKPPRKDPPPDSREGSPASPRSPTTNATPVHCSDGLPNPATRVREVGGHGLARLPARNRAGGPVRILTARDSRLQGSVTDGSGSVPIRLAVHSPHGRQDARPDGRRQRWPRGPDRRQVRVHRFAVGRFRSVFGVQCIGFRSACRRTMPRPSRFGRLFESGRARFRITLQRKVSYVAAAGPRLKPRRKRRTQARDRRASPSPDRTHPDSDPQHADPRFRDREVPSGQGRGRIRTDESRICNPLP